jgi:type II secretory pathway component PulK
MNNPHIAREAAFTPQGLATITVLLLVMVCELIAAGWV